jgi:hypothetical protein
MKTVILTKKYITMLYNVTEDLQKKNVSNRYMDVGINENVELTSVEYKPTEKTEFIAFYFDNEDKAKLSHTEWKIRQSVPLAQMEPDAAALHLRLVNEQIRRINAIVTTFISEEAFRKVKGDTFEEFCKATIAALGDSYKGVKVRIKVVYDKRNFTSLPKYTNYTWIERMTVPKEESEIKIFTSDRLTKLIPKRIEGADEDVKNILSEIPEKPKVDEDELPWTVAA